MGLVAGDGGDALHEIEKRIVRPSFFLQQRFDDFVGLGF